MNLMNHGFTEKYLQAVQALAHVKALDAEHPELHIRLVHFRKTGALRPFPHA